MPQKLPEKTRQNINNSVESTDSHRISYGSFKKNKNLIINSRAVLWKAVSNDSSIQT